MALDDFDVMPKSIIHNKAMYCYFQHPPHIVEKSMPDLNTDFLEAAPNWCDTLLLWIINLDYSSEAFTPH
jgi:hypothetical protein